VLLAVGNTSTAFVREKLAAQLRQALSLIEAGEPIVEIG
jgi:hypothetical protein